MIRMFSGLMAHMVGWLGRPFKKNGKVSVYRIVLVATFAMLGWGLWAGWVQWVLLGTGMTDVGASLLTFAARFTMLAGLAMVLLWCTAPPREKSDFIGFCFVMSLVISGGSTLVQSAAQTGFFSAPARTHYRATISCEHCNASCWTRVVVGESWTDWKYVGCCRCGIKVPPERVPEYAESRDAWEARIPDGGDDGAEN